MPPCPPPNRLLCDGTIPAERLDEIAEILAAGLIRLRSRQSSSLSPDVGEIHLDFSPGQRGHGRNSKREVNG
jgi:hypothetical protein